MPPDERALVVATRRTLDEHLEKRLGKALAVIDRSLKADDPALALRAAIDVFDRVAGKAVQRVAANVTTTDAPRMVSQEMLLQAARQVLLLQTANADDAVEVPPC